MVSGDVVSGDRASRDRAPNGVTTADDAVADIMTWPVAAVGTDAPFEAVIDALAADDVGALAVVRNGALVGIISERDVVRQLDESATTRDVTAQEMMTGDVISVRRSDPILAVARLIQDAGVRHLPVLDDSGLCGIVSIRDVLAVLVSALESRG